MTPCADPGFFFSDGDGVGVQKTIWTTFFFSSFLSPQLSLQFTEGSNGFITKKTILFQGSRGGPTFSGAGVQLLPGGGGGRNANFYRPYFIIYNYNFYKPIITCDFRAPYPPSGSVHGHVISLAHVSSLLIFILLACRRVVRQKPWAPGNQHSLSLLRHCLLSRQNTCRFSMGKTVTVHRSTMR